MPKIRASETVPYTVRQMYRLIMVPLDFSGEAGILIRRRKWLPHASVHEFRIRRTSSG